MIRNELPSACIVAIGLVACGGPSPAIVVSSELSELGGGSYHGDIRTDTDYCYTPGRLRATPPQLESIATAWAAATRENGLPLTSGERRLTERGGFVRTWRGQTCSYTVEVRVTRNTQYVIFAHGVDYRTGREVYPPPVDALREQLEIAVGCRSR